MSLVEMLPALRPVVAQLDRMGIPYYVGGSVASSIYGEPRSTLDNDLGVELPEAAVRELATNWNGEFYVSESAMRTAAPSGKSFNLIHYASVLQRRVPQEVVIDDETLSIWMATAEDVVLHKLI